MKRIILLAAVAAVAVMSVAMAADEKSTHASAAAAVATITGEVVDTGCYLGHEARGEKHVSCATKCITNGMPMGLLTDKGELYLLMLNHDNADPYQELKKMAGKSVAVSGSVLQRSGMKGIDVTAVKLAVASK